MFKKLTYILFFFVQVQCVYSSNIEYIRAYDLGESGLKTALFCYDKNHNKMEQIEPKTQLGICPDETDVSTWVRLRMREALDKDLDKEIDLEYSFGFSLAGLNKLRLKPFPTTDMSVLFELPSHKVRCIDDGAAHLVASLNTQDLKLPKGSIWNFAIGSGVGVGFTDNDHHVRNLFDFWSFFGHSPWDVKEPRTGLKMWIACGSLYGFDKIVSEHGGIIDDEVFLEFASRWKAYIETCILDYSTITAPEKQWGTPAALVFTGGHIDIHENRLVNTLKKLGIKIPVFTGPKNAGLLGAAWNVVTNRFGKTPLIETIVDQDIEKVTLLISQGVKVNERDALGNSPLITAIKTRNIELVKLLLTHGAEIDERDYVGQTGLYAAIKSDLLTMVQFLLDQGATVTRHDYWGQTLLSCATQNKEIENLLLKYGAKNIK